MDNQKITHIVLVVLVLVNIIGAGFLVSMQRKINILAPGGVEVESITGSALTAVEKEAYEAQLASMIAAQVQVGGTIKSISDDTIIINATVPKIVESKEKGASQGPVMSSEQRDISVKIDGSTSFEQAQRSALAKDDFITVVSDQSIYGKDSFVAKTITYIKPVEISTGSKAAIAELEKVRSAAKAAAIRESTQR